MSIDFTAADSTLTARKATLGELVSLLEDQHTRKFDVVAAASRLRAEAGHLVVAGAGHKLITVDGVSDTDVALRPTGAADGDIADKLGIPVNISAVCASRARPSSTTTM